MKNAIQSECTYCTRDGQIELHRVGYWSGVIARATPTGLCRWSWCVSWQDGDRTEGVASTLEGAKAEIRLIVEAGQ